MAKEGGKTTRLQRLLGLLENGSSEATRKAAARQLVDITRSHPQQIPSVIRKVHALLAAKSWDTRVAAGDALGCLAEAFDHASVADLAAQAEGQPLPSIPLTTLPNFHLQTILDRGNALLASGGQEYEPSAEDALLTPQQRLQKQRQQLKQRLGLDKGVGALLDAEELIGDEDLDCGPVPSKPASTPGGRAPSGSASASAAPRQQATELLSSMEGLSARERNRLKRKAKAMARNDGSGPASSRHHAGPHPSSSSRTLPHPGSSSSTLPPSHSGPDASGGSGGPGQGAGQGEAGLWDSEEAEWAALLAGSWPFQRLADQLCVDVLDPVWEVRHGAAVALREVLRSQAGAAGVEAPMADETSGWVMPQGTGKRCLGLVDSTTLAAAATANKGWLEECVVLLLCVLALDRFSDFGSDQVTAPVRETAAQALGMALTTVDMDTVQAVRVLLEQLQRQPEWDVRYGGYLGLKYLLAARLRDCKQLLPLALPVLIAGLQDADDDVRAASADALVPMASELTSQGIATIRHIQGLLWDLLGQLDELSPATASVMQLLSHLYALPDCCSVSDELTQLVPRLWPFLRHSLSGVRMSTLTCLERLLSASLKQASASWLQPILAPCLRLLFQLLLMESELRVQAAGLAVWDVALRCATPLALQHAVASSAAVPLQASANGAGSVVAPPGPLTLLQAWLTLAATTEGHPLDRNLLVVVSAEGSLVCASCLPLFPGGAAGQQPVKGNTSPAAKKPRGRGSAGNGAGATTTPTSQAVAPTQPAGGAGLHMAAHVVGASGEGSAVRMRMVAAQALGQLCSLTGLEEPSHSHACLLSTLTTRSALARTLAALTLWHWLPHPSPSPSSPPSLAPSSQPALASTSPPPTHPAVTPCSPPTPSQLPPRPLPPSLLTQLTSLLSSPACSQPDAPSSPQPYSEAQPYYSQLQQEVLALITGCMQAGWLLHLPQGVPLEGLGPDQAAAMVGQVPPEALAVPQVLAVQQRVLSVANSLLTYEQYLHLGTLACAAAAVVRSTTLPPKLNQIIQPLMAAIRKEPEAAMQDVCAAGLAELLLLCAHRTPCPNDKLVRNICSMAWGDPAATPSAAAAAETAEAQERQAAALSSSGGKDSIALPQTPKAANGVPTDDGAAVALVADAAVAAAAQAANATSPAAAAAKIARMGAEAALRATCTAFAAKLWTALPTLWTLVAAPLTAVVQAAGVLADLQPVVHALQLLAVVAPQLHSDLVGSVEALVPAVCACARVSNAAVRESSARCASSLAAAWLERLMPALLRQLVPSLSSASGADRLGAVQISAALVVQLGVRLVPYAVLLVVPLLKCMSDALPGVRQQASACFGSLVAILPLAQGHAPAPGLDEQQLATVARDSTFLMQLLDNKHADDYSLPMPVNVALRRYQQEGVNWLAFLRRFGLHGVLADDMGLGKTLQASCIMAAALTEQDHSLTEATAQGGEGAPRLACLVVCPSTLVQHWAYEMAKFIDPAILRPFAYGGAPAERAAQQKQLVRLLTAPSSPGGPDPAVNAVVMSYEHLRSDVDWVAGRDWLYACLDEGHVIKSAKTRVAQACKRITARHRLILSGTPIQNSVMELWALFDFLMPGFLGAERDFNSRFGKAVQAAKHSKKGSAEVESGLLAVEALHKQVMPFVLRRTKAQVLSDLPPKILQDVYCALSPLQHALYEDFQSSQAIGDAAAALQKASGGAEEGTGAVHVFQALQYMRKLCSHPALVLDLALPQHKGAVAKVLGTSAAESSKALTSALRDVAHAPKLLALKELLAQCGIISDTAGSGGGGGGAAKGGGAAADEGGEADAAGGSGHRLLVFAQLKGMLDLVERDVLQPCGVTYLRLDGSVESSQRFNIVQRFNADPTIDVLLLTTAVGGLGLNLTSADTVVFLEHDWNPMKDLQAMDRAHRLGQTRTVNVYRLLMKGTLEEKIMGLQQFKLDMANAVVNQENMSLAAMDTGKLLDLFGGNAGGAAAASGSTQEGSKGKGLAAMLAGMGEMWDEKEYEAEFNMSSFMGKLGTVAK